MPKFRSILLPLFLAVAASVLAAETAVVIDTPMPPPEWALLEREVLKAGTRASERFADR